MKDIGNDTFSKNVTWKSLLETNGDEIVSMYKSGMSTVVIGRKFNIGNKPIAKVLDSYGVERTGVGRRKWCLNESFFDEINNEEKAYIFGLFLADGSVSLKKSTISICLEESDRYMLERIREIMNSEKPLTFVDYSNKNDYGYSYKNQYRLSIYSAKMCKRLVDYGMVENKSMLLKFPNCIPDEMFRHFVRGYFDGNGSFCPYYTKNGKFQPLVTFTSTEGFCTKLRMKLQEELSIPCGGVYDAQCHNGITRVLSISGRHQTNKILDWMYADSTIYLIRKYEKYKKTFGVANSSLVV